MAPRGDPLVLLPAGSAARAGDLLAAQSAVPEQGQFSLWARGDTCADALELAGRSPERVRALVLESPTSELAVQVDVPTLVVCGSDADARVARTYRQQLAKCHLVLVYATSDDVANQRPEAFATLVGEFLERGERFIVNQRSGLLHP